MRSANETYASSCLTAGLAALLLGGCRNDPHTQLYIDNVNAEKRLLEDTLYDLQYDYECKIAGSREDSAAN